jgi:hypothetical protein
MVAERLEYELQEIMQKYDIMNAPDSPHPDPYHRDNTEYRIHLVASSTLERMLYDLRTPTLDERIERLEHAMHLQEIGLPADRRMKDIPPAL